MSLQARIEGVGFWTHGLPDWAHAQQFAQGTAGLVQTPPRPAPRLLAANERRRVPDSVAVALEVALAACEAAGRDPATLPSVFASTHGDLAITDYMCRTLASEPQSMSPTRFHNSVHNAAAGYWTIGAGALAPATAISAYRASFAQGLIEALGQLADGAEAVLLVAYDAGGTGALGEMAQSEGLLGGALVLSRSGDGPALQMQWRQGGVTPNESGALSRHAAANIMAPMLPLFDALACHDHQVEVHAGTDRHLALALS
ncbi:MAG TPA: beta-ketoacyl synthase chain length factor [Stenotrophomonas sp.]|jgi:hypothetical protein